MTEHDGAEAFIVELILAEGWALRYSPRRKPYAALLQGFGISEPGIKLHFDPAGGRIKVVGVIEHSYKIGVRRPYIFISLYQGVGEAGQLIKGQLLPRYKLAWYEAQPRIAKWFEDHPNT